MSINKNMEEDELFQPDEEQLPPYDPRFYRLSLPSLELQRKMNDSRKIYQDVIAGTLKEARALPRTPVKIDFIKGSKILVIKFFDLHFGEKIDFEGQKVFDMSVATMFMNEIIEHAMEVINFDFHEVILLFGGDLIEGDGSVYAGQHHHLEVGFVKQINTVAGAILNNVYRLSQFLGPNRKIRIIGIPGNHGLNKTAKHLHHPIQDNYDTAVYQHLENLIRNAQDRYNDLLNVRIDFAQDTHYLAFDIFNWKAVVYHKARKNPATPSGENEISAWEKRYQNLKWVFTGHWHDGKIVPVGTVVHMRAGCFPGPNDYSMALGIFNNEPEENLLVIDENKGLESIIIHNFKTYHYGKKQNTDRPGAEPGGNTITASVKRKRGRPRKEAA